VHSQLNAPIRASLAGEGLSLSHVILLENLIIRGEANGTQLAAAMSLTNGAVTQLLKKLEAVGLVTRTRREEDRRILHVQATHKARDRFERLHASTASELTEAFDGWTVRDIEKLQHLLTRLTIESK
jgi:DNA-binding MarR family transcriptional regulator